MLQGSWRDAVMKQTREAVQRSGGVAEITLDELSEALVKFGKHNVPSSIEKDLKTEIKSQCFRKY